MTKTRQSLMWKRSTTKASSPSAVSPAKADISLPTTVSLAQTATIIAVLPIQLAYIDYKEKRVGIGMELMPSGDVEADMLKIKEFYKGFTGKYPENFVV